MGDQPTGAAVREAHGVIRFTSRKGGVTDVMAGEVAGVEPGDVDEGWGFGGRDWSLAGRRIRTTSGRRSASAVSRFASECPETGAQPGRIWLT